MRLALDGRTPQVLWAPTGQDMQSYTNISLSAIHGFTPGPSGAVRDRQDIELGLAFTLHTSSKTLHLLCASAAEHELWTRGLAAITGTAPAGN